MPEKQYKKINGHGHLLPNPEQIPQFMKDKGYFWIENDRSYMCQGNWKRPITAPSFFLDEKLQWMDDQHIDHMVVITLSQLYANGLPKQAAKDMHSWYNDYQGLLQAHHSDRLTCGMVIQPAYMDQALKEIERCVTKLKLKVLCLPTHYQDQDGQWRNTAHESVDEIWELANELDLAVEVHPYDGQKIIALEDKTWRFHLVWMCAQTADHYHDYTLSNHHNRFPNIRVCYAHGNQYAVMNQGRRRQGFDGRPDLFKGKTHPDNAIGHPNIFFDTLVHDPLSLEMLIRRHGVSQIVAGLDDPYPLGEMDGIANGYPGKVIDEVLESGVITASDRKEIWNDNVLRWIGK